MIRSMQVGTADGDLPMQLTQLLMEKIEEELADPNMRFVILMLGLIFLGS